MDRRRCQDLLLENESLTDNLDDDSARALLDWGLARLDELPADQGAPQDEHFAALVQLMRGVNRLAASLPDATAEDLAALLAHHRSAFGAARLADAQACSQMAQSLAAMPLTEAVTALLDWTHQTATPPRTGDQPHGAQAQ